MLSTRQYLKKLERHQLRKLFDLCNLTENEKWLLIYAFVEKRLRENTCLKLNISARQYHYMLNIALTKVECKIAELDKIRGL
jgi:hypothetical protein